MSYRDDRRALRVRNEQLERELEDARLELAQLKEAPAPTAEDGREAEPAAPQSRGGATVGPILLGLIGLSLILLVRAPVAVVAGTLLLTAAGLSLVVRRLLLIPRPDEALVLTGRKYQQADGAAVGYRVARGRVLRLPVVESAQSIHLGVMPVPVQVEGATCADGVPLDITATAQVKVGSDALLLRRAVERFLAVPPASIATAAAQTLEGALRQTAAKLKLDQIDRDRLQLNELIAHDAGRDLEQRGLELIGFWLLEVDDDDGPLTARRREQAAAELRRVNLAAHDARRS